MSKIINYGISGGVIPPGDAVQTLTGNSGGAVSPDGSNNISILGTAPITVAGNPGDHNLIISAPTLTSTFVTNDGDATAAGNIINIVGANANVITSGSGNTVTISVDNSSQVVNYTLVTHAQSPYTVLPADYYIAVDVSAGVVNILLPNDPAVGRVFVIKDKAGLSQVDNITVTTVGGAVNIDGDVNFIMNNSYAAASFLFDGASYEAF